MSLLNFQIATKKVTFGGGALEFRGLSLNDVSALMGNHLAEIDTLFQMYEKEEQRDTAVQEAVKFATTIVSKSPMIAAKMIALTSVDDDDSQLAAKVAVAERLPLPVQVECVRAVFEITFQESGGAKKFLDSVMGAVTRMRATAKQD